jgi:ATP-dependent Clp protease protease subunit
MNLPNCKELRDKLAAEAEEARAKIRLTDVLTAKACLDLDFEKMTFAKRKREEDDVLASDYHNHVFRFTETVDEENVAACIYVMAKWSRMAPKCKMELVISSPGGDIIAGFALYDFIQELKLKGHHVTTKSLGISASMAGVLLQAGSKRICARQAWTLIHEGSCGVMGKSADVQDRVEWVKRLAERIVSIYADRATAVTGKDAKHIANHIRRSWLRKDWWLSSEEMLKDGFCDEIEG